MGCRMSGVEIKGSSTWRVSVQRRARQRPAPGKPAVQRMPVRDFRLAELPAQEDQTVSGERIEVDEATLQVLDHAPAPMDAVDAVTDALDQRLAARAQRLQLTRVGVAGGRPGGRQLEH